MQGQEHQAEREEAQVLVEGSYSTGILISDYGIRIILLVYSAHTLV